MFCISSAQGRHSLFYYRNSGNGISILADSIHIQNIHRLIRHSTIDDTVLPVRPNLKINEEENEEFK